MLERDNDMDATTLLSADVYSQHILTADVQSGIVRSLLVYAQPSSVGEVIVVC